MKNKNQNMYVPNSQKKNYNWLILLVWLIIVIGLAIGFSIVANIIDDKQTSKLDSYKLDYSDKLVDNTDKSEMRAFEFKVSSSKTHEDTSDISALASDEIQEVWKDTQDTELTNSKLLSYMGTKSQLYMLSGYTSTYYVYNNNYAGLDDVFLIELAYKTLKEQGFENGDIVTIHYDEPDLENKGSQDIEKAVIQYNYIKTVDKLNNTNDILEEDGTVNILVTSDTLKDRKYIIERLRDKVYKNEEYTLTLEKINHVVDYPQNIIGTVTKEY